MKHSLATEGNEVAHVLEAEALVTGLNGKLVWPKPYVVVINQGKEI